MIMNLNGKYICPSRQIIGDILDKKCFRLTSLIHYCFMIIVICRSIERWDYTSLTNI